MLVTRQMTRMLVVRFPLALVQDLRVVLCNLQEEQVGVWLAAMCSSQVAGVHCSPVAR
jgi:hypothetical protein